MTTFTGTTGDDFILGSADSDIFHLEQGGEDIALGKGGYEQFFSGAAFDSGDQIDGGGGQDTIWLDGDYSAGMVFTSTTMKNVENLRFVVGHDYVFSGLTDANLAGRLDVNGRFLGVGDSLRFDAAATTLGLDIEGGGGDDLLVGGSGIDVLDGGEGRNTLIGGAGADAFFLRGGAEKALGGDGDDGFQVTHIDAKTARDKIDGGAGTDFVTLSGGGVLVMRDATIQNIERLYATSHLDLTMADGNVAAGKVLDVDGAATFGGFRFDGALESDASFWVLGSSLHESTLIGGAGADSLYGGDAADVLIGGGGDDFISAGRDRSLSGSVEADTIIGGLGRDIIKASGGAGSVHFVFEAVEDSMIGAADRIAGLNDKLDIIDLSGIDADLGADGDQAFHLVSAFTGQAGELVVAYDADSRLTTVSGDVDGDGSADMVIELKGDHSAFTNFEL